MTSAARFVGLSVRLGVALATLAASPVSSQQIFFDAFESGSNCAWSFAQLPFARPIVLGLTVEPVPTEPGSVAGSCLGPGGELVFEISPPVAGLLRIQASANSDIGFYLLDACNSGVELLCADSQGDGGTESDELALSDTSPVYLVVDSWASLGDNVSILLELCGDGSVQPGEVCDGPDLGGQTCQSLGFTGGILACQADCFGFDTSGCIP